MSHSGYIRHVYSRTDRRRYAAPSNRLAIRITPHSGSVGTSVSAPLATGGMGGVTVLDSARLLFAVFKSGTSELTLTLLLMLLGVEVEVFSVTVTLLLPAASRVPSAQVKLAPFWLQVTDELTKLVWLGSVSVSNTLVAACGPAF